MAISTTSAGGNTTATITYTAPSAKMSAVLTDAAHYVWQDIRDASGNVLVTWEQATNAQRLAQLDKVIKTSILDMARAYSEAAAAEAARITAKTSNDTNYSLT